MFGLILIGWSIVSLAAAGPVAEEDWGDGLKVKVLYRPDDCVEGAKAHDVIHYHYVGRLFDTGEEFGKSFDYNTPYIVSLGNGYIIPGMDRGLIGTCLWERRRITFPASLGYGQAGAGEKIPPNATLTFYIRMVKIVRNGRTLDPEEQSFVSLYAEATNSYTLKEYNNAIALMEPVIPLHQEYRQRSTSCLQKCRNTSLPSLNEQHKALLNNVTNRIPFVRQYLLMAARGRCVSECKTETLRAELKVTSNLLMEDINSARYYDYLQYLYYQVDDPVEGARCAFTYYFMHPHETSIQNSVEYYQTVLKMQPKNYTIYREPGSSPQQTHYTTGSDAYHKKEWLKAIDNFEASFKLYKVDLDQCQAYCEDVFYINVTGWQFGMISGQNVHIPDMMDVYSLMAKAVEMVAECRVECYRKVTTINGVRHKGYLASIFNFLQFAYYTVGRLNDAAVCVASYQLMEPSDSAMSRNSLFYKSKMKIPEDRFVPRQDVVTLFHQHEMDLFLLEYIRSGALPKKKGVRGDTSKSFDYHSEL